MANGSTQISVRSALENPINANRGHSYSSVNPQHNYFSGQVPESLSERREANLIIDRSCGHNM